MHRLRPMRRQRARVAGFLALCVGSTACTPHPPPPSPRSSLLDAVESFPVAPPAASWRYHPSEAGAIYADRKLGMKEVLSAGSRGERWVVDLGTRRARSSAWLAPETLVGIDDSAEGQWRFVGASGTVYESASPLGPFERSSAPPLPFVTVHAESGPIVGVRADGSLSLTSDGGMTWSSEGPAGVRFADGAADERGRVLGLAVPEALWTRGEGGKGWTRLAVEPFGALEILRGESGGLCLRGVLEVRCYEPDRQSLVTFTGKLGARAHKLDATLSRGEDAAALVEGRAAVSQGYYFELVRSSRWQLITGPFGGSLTERDVEPLKVCKATRIAAFGTRLTVGCIASSPEGRSAQPVRFFTSHDRGRSWSEEPFTSRASSDLRIALGPDGALVVTGICPPHEQQPGCAPNGVYYRARPRRTPSSQRMHEAPERTAWALLPAALPGLSGVAEGLAFSSDGSRAYAVGAYSKSGDLALFVSHDRGRQFDARHLQGQSSGGAVSGSSSQPPKSGRRLEGLAVLADGTVSVVFRGMGGRPTLVVTDEEGRSVSTVGAPAETKLLLAAGSKALAFSPDARGLFESTDGGSTWARTESLPVQLCVGDRDCRVPLYCSEEGCVFTDVATRVGWGTAPEERVGLLPPPEPESSYAERRLRTPVACAFDPDTRWIPIAGAQALPTAAQSALGETVWFVTTTDPSQAASGMALAQRSRDQVAQVSLLAPVRAPERYAVALVGQVEGAAAMRYRTPESGTGTEIKDIEVAWNNLLEGQLERARIPSAGAYRPGDYIKADGAQKAQPSLLSIARGGIYVIPHQAAGTDQSAYFLDGQQVVSVRPYSWPALGQLIAHTEMAHVEGHHVGIAFAKGGAAVIVARRAGTNTELVARAIGLSRPDRFGVEQSVDITYLGREPALHIVMSRPSGDSPAFVFPLKSQGPALGEPIPVPGQASTSDPPRACDRAARQSTPRLVVSSPSGAAHPVLVTGGSEPVRALLTSEAVMHGTVAAPCVAVLDARGVLLGDAETAQERALLPLDDLERSWLFRLAIREEVRSVEVRPMRCRFEPKAIVPPELAQAAQDVERGTR